MFEHLYKYLVLYKKVNLPGIGAFNVHRHPASHDFAREVFIAPDFQINFTPGTPVASRHFYSFVSFQQKITGGEAIEYFNDFTKQLRQELDENRNVNLPGLGRLFKKDSGDTGFEPEPQLHNYLPEVAARVGPTDTAGILINDTVNRNRSLQKVPVEKKQEVVEKSYWWVYAIVLALVGIGAIVYYYVSNGSLE